MSNDLEKAQEMFNQGLWVEATRRNEFFAIVLKSLIEQEKKNEYIEGIIEALALMDKLNLLAIIEIAKVIDENLPEKIKKELEQEYNRYSDATNKFNHSPDYRRGFNAGAKHIDGYLTLIKK